MILDFEKIANTSRNFRQLALKFGESLASYYDAFEAWKAADTKKLVDSLISHWLELERLYLSITFYFFFRWLSVRHSQDDAGTEWHPKIAKQQKSIMEKIAKFGLHAMKKLKREQKKLVEAMGLDQELKPEFADIESDSDSGSAYESDSAMFGTSPDRFPANSFTQLADSVKSSKQRESSPLVSNPPMLDPLSFEKQAPKSIPSPSTMSTDLGAPAAPLAAQPSFGAALSNEALAHELVRNPDFQLKPKKKSKLEKQITEQAMKAFFDTAREQFSKGIYVNFVPSLLQDIKTNLLKMVSVKGAIGIEINATLDIELAKQQMEHGVFNVNQCSAYVISKMTQLCAPVRDQSIRDISLLPDLASQFQKCLQVLELMNLDLANYRLQSLAPVLKEQAVEYEMKKFTAAVESGAVSLANTRAWLGAAFKSLDATARARNPDNVVHPDNKVRFEDVYNESLMNLVFGTKALDPSSVPETLMLDAHYIFKLQNEVNLPFC
jgi:hypothetical protein